MHNGAELEQHCTKDPALWNIACQQFDKIKPITIILYMLCMWAATLFCSTKNWGTNLKYVLIVHQLLEVRKTVHISHKFGTMEVLSWPCDLYAVKTMSSLPPLHPLPYSVRCPRIFYVTTKRLSAKPGKADQGVIQNNSLRNILRLIFGILWYSKVRKTSVIEIQ